MARGDLDDFELERTPYTPRDEPELDRDREPGRESEREAEPEPAPARGLQREPELELDAASAVGARPSPRLRSPETGNRTFLLTLAAVALIAFGVLVLLFVVFRTPAKPKAVEAASATPARPAASASPAPVGEPGPLPPLDSSDEYLRGLAAGLSSQPELARWLSQAGLARTFVAVVTNVGEGETPRPFLSFLAPSQRFRAKGANGRRIVADPAGYAGYDRFADVVASIDAGAAAAAFRTCEPLLDAAYRELGHPEGGFRQGLDRAIAALLATPLPPADAELVPHATGFRWADPKLEGLTAAQKQFLRTGPRNVQLVQAKLRELQAALGAAEQGPPADRAR